MTLKVVGTGLPRTGTTSLSAALATLLGEPCYHMTEFFPRVEKHGPLWWKVLGGDPSPLAEIFDGFGAAVDWPASLAWRELVEANPDALVLHTHRTDAATWWKSVDQTVWESMRRGTGHPGWDGFVGRMLERTGLGDAWDDRDTAMAHYESLHAEVVATVPADRLLVWQPGDGWEPLCTALRVAVPSDPFPRLNNTAEFRAQSGWE